MTACRHHYLPEAYLKGFADDASRPQLQVFDLKTRSRFAASPDNVAVERDFNRVDIPGRPIDQLEDMLTQCTRDSSSGEPKRFSRGGGLSSGMRRVSNGLSTPASRASSLSLKPVPARPA
jgi:hypothetical protein